MALEQLRLTETGNSHSYDISMIQEVNEPQRKEAFSIAPPGQAPSDNILLGVSGMQADLEIRFMVHDDGTDKANGTATGEGFTDDTVVTLQEQRDWLLDHIHRPSFSAKWTLDHLTGDLFSTDDVYVETVEIPAILRDSPKWLPARIGLIRGGAIG